MCVVTLYTCRVIISNWNAHSQFAAYDFTACRTTITHGREGARDIKLHPGGHIPLSKVQKHTPTSPTKEREYNKERSEKFRKKTENEQIRRQYPRSHISLHCVFHCLFSNFALLCLELWDWISHSLIHSVSCPEGRGRRGHQMQYSGHCIAKQTD